MADKEISNGCGLKEQGQRAGIERPRPDGGCPSIIPKEKGVNLKWLTP